MASSLAAAEGSALGSELVDRLSGYDQALLDLARRMAFECASGYPSGPLFWNGMAGAFRVTRGNRSIHLGPTEFRILQFLMQHARRVFSREHVLEIIWGRDSDIDPHTVDVYIRGLRKALNIDGAADIFHTVRQAGYAMDVETGEMR